MTGPKLDHALLAVAVGLMVLVPATAVAGVIDLRGEHGSGRSRETRLAAAGAIDGATATDAGHGATAHTHGLEYDIQYRDLPGSTRGELDIVRDIIDRYPTAAAAERDGWHKATINLKGIASHYLKGGVGGFVSVDGRFDVREPEILLFNGEGPDAPIAGVSYLLAGPDPEGFHGKWDVWHRHQAVCFARGLVIAEVGGHEGSRIDMSREQCTAESGITFPLANLTMLHVWMKSGFESSAGVFSHDHPELYGDAS